MFITKKDAMRSYKFKTRISKDGTIQIPHTPSLFNKEVEITIVPKTKENEKRLSAEDFVKKWAGFLISPETDSSKLV